jgi:Rrf2 family protein
MSLIRITTKDRYALRMMVELAETAGSRFISLRDISESIDVSKKYLEQIVPSLVQAGLLATVRGPLGGYRLAKPANEISVAEILHATDGGTPPISCVADPGTCDRSRVCPTIQLWKDLDDLVNGYLEKLSLQQLVEQHQAIISNSWVI